MKKLLPRDFLESVAQSHNLSPEQTEALVKRLGDEATAQETSAALHISDSALRSRMTEIYKKFSIRQAGPNKFYRLRELLWDKYQNHQKLSSQNSEDKADIETLIQEIRSKVNADIHARCGTMRVLDMEQPIGLGDIYTSVNILEKLLGHRRLSLNELIKECDIENFDRFALGQVTQRRVPGLEAVEQYDQLIILGKPGAGKTTFMKRMATLCNQGEFQNDRVPVFVTLKEFAEAKDQPELGMYIGQQWQQCGVKDANATEIVLSQGRALILLDGLDEVQETDHKRVLEDIKTFSHKFRACQFVMTCRIAAREYTFEQFTEVEVADFDDEQITEFANKWFSAKRDPKKSETFIQRLENNAPIKELATNPLLLTLLCLVFGEAADFPANRSELYKEGLDVLLKKWDAKRNIERDQVYKKLSLKRKEDLLSQLAFYTFDRGDYFFKQAVVERQIVDYICNLPGAQEDEEALQLDGADVLASIEAQHGLLVERARGIYSFSHLTFQEFFTAKQITRPTAQLYEELGKLSEHITEKRYREIFLLAVGMLPEADDLLCLIKQEIDQLLIDDLKLQEFLNWISRKTKSVDVFYKDAITRSFYFVVVLDLLNSDVAFGFEQNGQNEIYFDLLTITVSSKELDNDLNLDLTLVSDFLIARSLIIDSTCAPVFSLDRFFAFNLDSKLMSTLESLSFKLANIKNHSTWEQWWIDRGQSWTEDFRAAMIEHRNIGHDWQFTAKQQERLQQYYNANKLLWSCLNSDCYVTKATRQEIEDTLLLPISEIEKRKIK